MIVALSGVAPGGWERRDNALLMDELGMKIGVFNFYDSEMEKSSYKEFFANKCKFSLFFVCCLNYY